MKNVFLIIQREFLSRVRKRSFLLATILVPLLFPGVIGGMIFIMVQNEKNKQAETVQLLNESQQLVFEDSDRYQFKKVDGPLEAAKNAYRKSDDFALLYVPSIEIHDPSGIKYYSQNSPGLSVVESFERDIRNQIRDIKLKRSGLTEQQLDSLETTVSIATLNLNEEGEQQSSAALSSGIGYVVGMIIYVFLFAYGSQVMQGVIEEKNTKIVEVILSAVRPFHLMMGKVVGVASVGIFQFFIWVILVTAIWLGAVVLIGLPMSSGELQQISDGTLQASEALQTTKVQNLLETIYSVPWLQITLLFLFYFVFGYLFYGALFAAVGSAVDTPADAQQFMLPIMLPIIVGLMGLFLFVFREPNGAPSFWLSIIPFTSPIVMLGRIGFGVPTWEIILSMVLLILGCLFTLWLAGRIYRIGILVHGAKVNYKVLAKWLIMKN